VSAGGGGLLYEEVSGWGSRRSRLWCARQEQKVERHGTRAEQGSKGGLVGWPMKHGAISNLFKHFSNRFELQWLKIPLSEL
jgi:hypothetical protein